MIFMDAPLDKIKALKDAKFEKWIIEQYYGYVHALNEIEKLKEQIKIFEKNLNIPSESEE